MECVSTVLAGAVGFTDYTSAMARGVMVIVVGSGHSDTSSNPGRE